MKPEQIIEQYTILQAAEADQPMMQIWCSMADPDLPKGSQFLGAVVVEAQGPATATHELNMRGLNLGGEIAFVGIPDGQRVPEEWMYRVMNKEEAKYCPMITK